MVNEKGLFKIVQHLPLKNGIIKIVACIFYNQMKINVLLFMQVIYFSDL